MNPFKRTREDSTYAENPEEGVRGDPAAAARPPHVPESGRTEKGSGSGSARHRPRGATDPDVDNSSTGQDTDVLPPNAQGTDKIPVDQKRQPIDEASMYDRRPSEDKDRPPSRTRGQ